MREEVQAATLKPLRKARRCDWCGQIGRVSGDLPARGYPDAQGPDGNAALVGQSGKPLPVRSIDWLCMDKRAAVRTQVSRRNRAQAETGSNRASAHGKCGPKRAVTGIAACVGDKRRHEACFLLAVVFAASAETRGYAVSISGCSGHAAARREETVGGADGKAVLRWKDEPGLLRAPATGSGRWEEKHIDYGAGPSGSGMWMRWMPETFPASGSDGLSVTDSP